MTDKIDELLARDNWNAERRALREIMRAGPLEECVKWRQLCYTYEGANVAIIFAMKDTFGVSFFKGALLKDPKGMLVMPGPNSQAGRMLKLTSLEELAKIRPVLEALVAEAVEVEKAGLKVDFAEKHQLELPEELEAKFRDDAAFKAAFMALTPGRQRGYTLFFTGAKQAATRAARIDKHRGRIMDGKGMHDR